MSQSNSHLKNAVQLWDVSVQREIEINDRDLSDRIFDTFKKEK